MSLATLWCLVALMGLEPVPFDHISKFWFCEPFFGTMVAPKTRSWLYQQPICNLTWLHPLKMLWLSFGRIIHCLFGSNSSWVILFVIGQLLIMIMGSVFVLWAMFTPEFKIYQRNWKFCSRRDVVNILMDDDYDDDNGSVDWRGLFQDQRGWYDIRWVKWRTCAWWMMFWWFRGE